MISRWFAGLLRRLGLVMEPGVYEIETSTEPEPGWSPLPAWMARAMGVSEQLYWRGEMTRKGDAPEGQS